MGYAVPATVFPANAHYVALGHLHRSQQVIGPCPVRYSGSPLAVDFGEEENVCSVAIVEVTAEKAAQVRDVPVTAALTLRTVRGTLEQLADGEPAGRLAAGLRPGAAPGRAARGRAGAAAERAGGPHRPGHGAGPDRGPDGAAGRAARPRQLFGDYLDSRGTRRGRRPRALRRALRRGEHALKHEAAAAGHGRVHRVPRRDHRRLHRRRLLRPGRPDRLGQVDGARRDLLRPLRHGAALGRQPGASATRSPRPRTRPGSGWSSSRPAPRYVATRVVRRDGRGNVKTAGAGPAADAARLRRRPGSTPG